MHAQANLKRSALGLFVAAALGIGPALAQDAKAPELPDLSKWECRNCEFDYGWYGSILFGPGWVSDDFFEFGNYSGLEERGLFAEAGIDLSWRDEDGMWLEILGEDLGHASRDLFISGGKQGVYKAWLNWDEIATFRADDTRTIFDGAGSAFQTLPAGWIKGGRSDDLPLLADSLRPFDIKQDREILGIGFEFGGKSPWTYGLDVQRTTKSGSRIKGASFIFQAMELASPLNHETTELDATLGYGGQSWEMQAAYNLSIFDNRNRQVRWENPFFGIFGSDLGELAEPPDNRFHQIMLSGSWRPNRRVTLAGHVAAGRIDQDADFLAFTLNPGLAAPALPQANLDGEVDTRALNLRATGVLTRKLRATVQFKYDERDNNTPRISLPQFVSDTFVQPARVNEPYSFERRQVDFGLDYRMFRFLKLNGDVELTETQRDFQEVRDTDTFKAGVKARVNPHQRVNLTLEYFYEERTNDLDPSLLPQLENPGLRRFHFAEKERDAVRLAVDFAISETYSAGLYAEIADEDFTDTQIGLSRGRDERYGVDLGAAFNRHVHAHAFFGYELLDATILGADNVNGSPWEARQEDEFFSAGAGIEFNSLPGKWVKATLDFNWASSRGDIEVRKRGTEPTLPELQTDRYTFEAAAERKLSERLNLRLNYLVGRLTEDDFFRDRVEPATLPNLLSLGEGTPGDTVHVISAALRYEFR
ncbi:MAG: MtrB/PioB family decaheme-associated outer membrane protein [Wenzhouxiangellaceae bacterium]|nr:MtrB/PioB family decaheme-associated outer membrane protein [Wenzhouxiangellaceae bacterium]